MNTYTSTVHPLHDTSVLDRAQSLWHAADYTACLDLLEGSAPSAERFLLAARASYRLRRYDDALAHLGDGHVFFRSPEAHAEADALSAVLYEIKGSGRESDTFYERACANASQVGNACNMLALRAWLRDDYAECLRRLRGSEGSPDSNVRAYAASMRSWIHGSRTEFVAQARFLEETLSLTLSSRTPDVGLVAETLQTLSHQCREMHLPDQFTAVCSTVGRVPWTNDLRVQHYNTLRHIGWTQALRGEYVFGLRHIAKARDMAPSRELAALSTLDAAWVAWASGENNGAEASLCHALDVITATDWQLQTGEEIRTLLLAAELCAIIDTDAARARKILSLYESVKQNISARFATRHNRILDPIECYVRALLFLLRGEVALARKHAKQAYRTLDELGYDWRAARCALLLYESGCGDTWLAAAKEKAKHYPRSFIGAQLQRVENDLASEPLSRLTPRQREVARLLAAGSSIDDVADTLKTSRNTVRVHVQHIHRALGVRNRVELLKRTAGIAI